MTPQLRRLLVRAADVKERALGLVMASRLPFVHHSWLNSWPLRPDLCPCDVDFCEYLRERNIRRKSIFHFGTGGHHVVGIRNRDEGLENEVLGITASPTEHAQYVTRVIQSPALGRHYRVWFADIYDLSPACLPTFDVATLFHLCEFTDAAGIPRRMNDTGVLDMFLANLAPRGRLLFYTGSFAYPTAAPLIEQAVAAGRMSLQERYKSLLVYQIPVRTSEPFRPTAE